MSAPERIWANEGLEWHSFDCSDVKAGWTHPYILATPEALAAAQLALPHTTFAGVAKTRTPIVPSKP